MHLNTTKCCNHTFTGNDVTPPLLNQEQVFGSYDPNLYGGNVEKFTKAKCPECGRSLLLWLKPEDQRYKVITISEIKEDKAKPRTIKK
ncbi:MAG TPA: hypothetical protein VEA37_09665 [Flavobacterium sp.]|nr:hypothetical protein [Flavobacterium sp.]